MDNKIMKKCPYGFKFNTRECHGQMCPIDDWSNCKEKMREVCEMKIVKILHFEVDRLEGIEQNVNDWLTSNQCTPLTINQTILANDGRSGFEVFVVITAIKG